MNTYFWPVAVQYRAASGVSDVHSMFRMAGELLDLALFGVVQQPEARGGPECAGTEKKIL